MTGPTVSPRPVTMTVGGMDVEILLPPWMAERTADYDWSDLPWHSSHLYTAETRIHNQVRVVEAVPSNSKIWKTFRDTEMSVVYFFKVIFPRVNLYRGNGRYLRPLRIQVHAASGSPETGWAPYTLSVEAGAAAIRKHLQSGAQV